MKPVVAARSLLRRLRDLLVHARYLRAINRCQAAGDVVFAPSQRRKPSRGLVEVKVLVEDRNKIKISKEDAERWCRLQTLPELSVVGHDRNGVVLWRVPEGDPDRTNEARPSWFAAPGVLPLLTAAHIESSLLVAAAEGVQAVVHRENDHGEIESKITSAGDAQLSRCRPFTLYRSDAYEWDPSADEVRSLKEDRLIKLVGSRSVLVPPRGSNHFNRFRRGPYLSSSALGPFLCIPLAAPPILECSRPAPTRTGVLVLAPFLARGGAEQTLFATMLELCDRFEFTIATLAPHCLNLGDRRADFRTVTKRVYSLGDLVHPAAMMGILLYLIDSMGLSVVYNANGTTLFYEFAPLLKEARPHLRIIDHLYDHRVGYVDRYEPSLQMSVDACIAENHAIAKELVDHRGWPADRVPVIWPCGRAESELPPDAERPGIRARVRAELGIEETDLVFLMAARMHEQKRPLDLVALADRVQDLASVRFLMVGGGNLEDAVDAAIASNGKARVRRLPFRDDILDVILAADVGVLASDFEGLPVFLLECLQLGRPFLGTRVGDLGTVIDQTGAGLVVDRPGDLDALEAAVRRLLDPGFRREVGRHAVRAAPRFKVEACARAYEQVFHGAG